MRCAFSYLAVAVATVAVAGVASPARGQTTITISMAAAPATPRINGALIVGVLTGTPVLHTIAATGTPRPTYTATGLPAGLTLNATNGRISGTLAAAGRTTAMITAANSAGSDTKALTFVAGDTLALTPPMGWNSYDSFDDSVNQAEFLPQATWLRDNLQPYGWDTVVVDFRWYDPNAPSSDQGGSNPNLVTDANGRFLPAPGRFPSATGDVGFRVLAQMVHDMGLKFGIHIMRGMPRKTYNANTTIANSTFTAQQAGDTAKICRWNADNYGVRGDTAAGQAWYDSLFSQYATWGVDFVKVDDITSNPGATDYWSDEVEAIHRAIAKSGRSMVLSLSPGETPVAQASHLTMHANMWRQSDDFWDRAADLNASFTLAQRWAVVTGPPGHWPDADMLPIGRLGPRCPINGANRLTAFTRNEQVLMLSLWAIMPSPLMLGANMVTSNDAFMNALLTNDEVIAVSQDALGARGRRIVLQGNTEVWVKDLSGGRKAVALFNRGTADATVTATFAQVGVTGTQVIRDLWRRADVTGMTSGLSVSVPARAGLLYALSAPVTGTGGAGGGTGGGTGGSAAGGAGGRGGAAGVGATGGINGGGGVVGSGGGPGPIDGGVGGTAGTGGSGTIGSGGSGSPDAGAATGGAIGTGGSGSIATGGSGGVATGTGGATSSGGTNGGGGAGTGASGAGGSAGGCGCAIVGTSASTSGWLMLGLGVSALMVRRRRRK